MGLNWAAHSYTVEIVGQDSTQLNEAGVIGISREFTK